MPTAFVLSGGASLGAVQVGMLPARLRLRAPAGVKLHVVPPLCPLSVAPVDFSHSGELIERADSATRGMTVFGDAVPGGSVAGEARPGEAQPDDAVPGEAQPGEAGPDHAPAGDGPEPEEPLLYGTHLPPVRLPWRWASSRLAHARSYWVATAHADGRPHTRPVWGIWRDDTFYFSTGSRAVANLARSPEITVHLESASEVVIVEGTACLVADATLRRGILTDYNAKYHWDMDPDDPPGPIYQVQPRVVFGWVVDPTGLDGGSAFHATATRWRFG